jgi:hypothetical protein
MVPLVHTEGAAVKMLAVGTVGGPVLEQGEWVVQTGELSDLARLTEAETCGRFALVETPRRGTEPAHTVCAVSAGAEWMQGFVERQRPEAVRMLDLPQAVGYVAPAGHAVYGEGTPAFTRWFATQRQLLPRGDPAAGVRALRRLGPLAKRQGAAAAVATVQERRADLENRRALITSARFPAQGDPIGSGSGRERQEGGRRESAEGGRHALGTAAGQSTGGPAHPCWQRPVGGSLATDRAAGAATGLAAAAPAPGSPLTATASGRPEHPTHRRPGHQHDEPTAGRTAHAAHGPPLVRAAHGPRPQSAVPTAARPPLASLSDRPSQLPSPQRGCLRKTLTETQNPVRKSTLSMRR